MSEDFQIEDQAEKLAADPTDTIIEYLNEHNFAQRNDIIDLLMERRDLTRDQAEKVIAINLKRGKLRYDQHRRGYTKAFSPSKFPRPRIKRFNWPIRRKAKAPLHTMLRLPPDPHTLPNKSAFLAKHDPSHPYYHPAMDTDRLAYLRAKEKMGAGADWPA